MGSVYALILARHNDPPFQNRSGPIDEGAVVKRARNVESGEIRLSGAWLAGFYFNSALFRIAATYDRGIKTVVGRELDKKITRDHCMKKVGPMFPKWTHNNLDEIYKEVNCLKHDGRGLFQARSVTWTQAKEAIAELLELFELWANAPPQALCVTDSDL